MRRQLATVAVLIGVALGCSRTPLAPCPYSQQDRNGRCVAVAVAVAGDGGGISCGPGTFFRDNQCVASPRADAASPPDRTDAAVDGGATPDVPPPMQMMAALPGAAVTFQIDWGHGGGQPTSRLRPPLTRRWSVTLPSRALSYPLIVGGAVFITESGGAENRLYALSAADGTLLWGPVSLGASTSAGSGALAAWDSGRVFTISGEGIVSAFDAANGAPIWRRMVGSSSFFGPPVAANGAVFVVPGGVLTVLDEVTGAVLWTGTYEGGVPTSVAFRPGIAVLEYIDGALTGFDSASGATLWLSTGCCTGGGGDVPVIYGERIYARDFWEDPNVVLDLWTGRSLGGFSASTVPAFENGLGFFLAGATLEARDMAGALKWSFAGDGALASTPLAAGGFVYEGSTAGNLYAVDEVTGKEVWSDRLRAAVAPANETDRSGPTVGLAASLDLLVVPAGATVTAYGN